MSSNWLDSADPASAWSCHAWSEFAGWPERERERMLVILPVHGLADHGLGLALDAEEVVGTAVLRLAGGLAGNGVTLRILPPLRLVLAPYPSTFFGVDPETAHALIHEIAGSVHAAGFRRLVFFNTSPWMTSLLDAAALDVRAALNLTTVVLNLGGLGLDFHPTAATRAATQAVAASLLGTNPAPSRHTADIRDPEFRPVQHRRPAPVPFDASIDGSSRLEDAARHCARLLREISARGGDGPTAAVDDSSASMVAEPTVPPWPLHRRFYLPALTAGEIEDLPDKASALVILPLGAIEQHGHHLPVGVDAMLGQIWLAHTLPRLPEGAPVFVAPSIAYGKSNEHAGFAGTVSLSAGTLRRMLLASARQLHALGFRQLAVLNTHGGNSAVLEYTLREIQVGLDMRAGVLRHAYVPEQTAQEAAHGFHAGEWETALMLAATPELVHMDRAICEYPASIDDPGELRLHNAAAVLAWMTRDISQSGVMGNAPAATAENGRRWLEEGSAALAARINALLALGPPRSTPPDGQTAST